MFELLTGTKPFSGEDILDQHLTAPLPPLSRFNPSVTELQDSVVRRLMAKRPEARFKSMKEASEAVESCFSNADMDDATVLG